MRIERTRIDGEPVRRFYLLAEVTFADRAAEPRDRYDRNYYQDSELKDLVSEWMSGTLEDRDDMPAVRFHEVPESLKRCVNDTNGDGDCAACARNPQSPCRQLPGEGS